MSDRYKDFEDEEEEEEASWQDSYSDLITDLLAVFVILFSFAMMSQAAVANSAKNDSIVNVLPEYSGSENAVIAQEVVQSGEEEFNKLYESINEYIEQEELHTELETKKIGNDQILLRAEASVFFNSGKAEIHENSMPILETISDLFVEYEKSIKIIRIEGHTDNIPMHSPQFDSNWELSTSRAVNVLRRLIEISQLAPKKFSAVGYSEFYPIADNHTAAGREKNRRVDFFIEAMPAESSENTE